MPQVDYNISTFDIWIMRLSRQGYGDYDKVRNLEINKFFGLIHYEMYLDEYSSVFQELNKKK